MKVNGSLSKKMKTVGRGIRRVLYRPNHHPPRLYFITEAGVVLCNPSTFNEAALLSRGYVRGLSKTDYGTRVYEKQVKWGNKQR